MKDREFSIEESYHIFVFFLMDFWWNVLKGIMVEKDLITDGMTPEEIKTASESDKVKDILYEANHFVFTTIPGSVGGCPDIFETLLKERLNICDIKKHRQHIPLKENQLFQIIVDFSNYFTKNFEETPEEFPKDALVFANKWLEDMRTHPDKHIKEWGIWNKTILNVTKNKKRADENFTGKI